MKIKAIRSTLSNTWHYAGLLFVILIVMGFSAGCSMIRTHKNAPTLSSVTAGHIYQIRVRTGNLALDRVLYEYAMRYVRKS